MRGMCDPGPAGMSPDRAGVLWSVQILTFGRLGILLLVG